MMMMSSHSPAPIMDSIQPQPGTQKTAYVSHVDSPSCFWVQLKECNPTLESMADTLDACYNSAVARPLSRPSKGAFCVARFSEDDNFYRAAILDSRPNNRCFVHFIDYGNSEETNVADLKEINLELMKVNALALPCTLCGLPATITHQMKELFRKLALDQNVVVDIMGYDSQKRALVKIFSDGVDVTQRLLGRGPTNPPPPPLMATSPYPPLTPITVPTSPIIPPGACAVSPFAAPFVPAAPVISPLSKSPLPELSPGRIEKVYISYVDNPGHFYIQLEQNMALIDKLAAALHHYCTTSAPSLTVFLPGQLCCAKYADDDVWYRALILIEPTGPTVPVRFIDFGNTYEVCLQNVKAINREIASVPVLALACTLDPRIKKWFEEQIEIFNSMVSDECLLCQAVGVDPRDDKIIVALSNSVGKDITHVVMAAMAGDSPVRPQGMRSIITTGGTTLIHDNDTASLQADELQEISITVGQVEEVQISSMNDPGHFTCQMLKFSMSLDQLMDNLSETYTKMQPGEAILPTAKRDLVCCAQFSRDNSWYRAQITAVHDSNQCEVYYIDYGNAEYKQISTLKRLLKNFTKIPKQAVFCRLYGFQESETTTSDEAIAFFESLVSRKVLEMEFKSSDSGCYDVTLVDPATNVDINREFFARFQTFQVPMMQRSVATPPSNVSTRLNMTRSTTRDRPVTLKSLDIQMGREESLIVVFVEHPGSFWCQLQRYVEKLEQLSEDLQQFYTKSPRPTPPLTSMTPGSACAARFTEDGLWYRAEILASSVGEITVRFVDFGNTDIVSEDSIRVLDHELTRLPAQGLRCRLVNVQPTDRGWDRAVTSRFEEATLDKDLCAFTVDRDMETGAVNVFLGERSGEHCHDIGQNLQSLGLVKLVPSALHSPFAPTLNPIVGGEEDGSGLSLMDRRSDGVQPAPLVENGWGGSRGAATGGERQTNFGSTFEVPPRFRRQQNDEREGGRGPQDGSFSRGADSAPGQKSSWGSGDTGAPRRGDSREGNRGPRDSDNRSTGSNWGNKTSDDRPSRDSNWGNKSNDDKPRNSNWGKSSSDTSGGAMAEPEVDDSALDKGAPSEYSSLTPDVGSQHKITISWAVDPGQIWAMLLPNIDGLMQLMNDLQKYCQSKMAAAVTDVTPGTPSLAKSPADNTWYRVTIVASQGPTECRVYFVDFGNTDVVPRSALRVMKGRFLRLARQALPCSLHDLAPTPPGQWSAQAVDKLQQLFQQCESHDCTVVEAVDGKMSVKIASKGQDFAETLVTSGHAVRPSAVSVRPPATRITGGDPLRTGAEVYVSHVDNPHQFFVQESSVSEYLEKMSAQLQEYYSGLSPTDVPGTLDVGGVVCAKYSADGQWYRAEVLTTYSDGSVSVCFVDYGNPDHVQPGNLRPLSEKHALTPPFAVKCRLNGVKPTGQNWSESETEAFSALTLDKPLSVVMTSHPTSPLTTLVAEEGDVSELLIAWGSALAAPPSVIIPTRVVEVATSPEVYVTYIETPDSFYVQLSSDSDQIDRLSESLQEVYGGETEVATYVTPGDYVCSRFTEDQLWYRSVVESNDSGQVTVRFVDYGNTDTVTLDDIRVLTPDHIDPPLAVRCCISDLKPSAADWSDEEVDVFRQLTSDRPLTCEFLTATEPYGVAVSEESGSLSDTLTAGGCGVLKSAPQIIEDSPLPQEGVEVYMSTINTPSLFYIQLASVTDQLDDIGAKIAQIYNTPSSDREVGSVVTGDYVCAQFTEDGLYYRAKVTGVEGADVKVVFVDYGNTDTVAMTTLKRLTPDLISVPKCAVECALHGATPSSPGVYSESEIARFSMETTDVGFTCQFMEKSQETGRVTVKLTVGDRDLLEILQTTEPEVATPATEVVAMTTTPATDVTAIPPAVIPENVSEGYISHINSPDSFHIQLSASTADIESVAEKLLAYLSEQDDKWKVDSASVRDTVCAKFSEDGLFYRCQVVATEGSNFTVNFVDFGNDETVEVGSLRGVDPVLMSTPSLAIHCKLDGIRPSDGAWTESEIGVFSALTLDKPLQCVFTDVTSCHPTGVTVTVADGDLLGRLLESGCGVRPVTIATQDPPTARCEAFVSHAVSPGEFYLQLASNTEHIDTMAADLQIKYSSIDNGEFDLTRVAPGDVVSALYSEDGQWYRAVVLTTTDDVASTQFLDYGNVDDVSLGSIKRLTEELHTTYRLAIRCVLDGIQPSSGGVWNTTESLAFVTAVMDEPLMVDFKSQCGGGRCRVSVMKGGVDLVTSLVAGGCGVSCDTAVHLYPCPMPSDGDEVEVHVSHVETPNNFYVQPVELSSSLEELGASLQTLASDPLPLVSDVDVGGFVCVKFTADELWYRAIVQEVSGDLVTVLFVDYGNTDFIARDQVHVLPPEVTTLPRCAANCSLTSIRPHDRDWTDAEIDAFNNFVADKTVALSSTLDVATQRYDVTLKLEGVDIIDSVVQSGCGRWEPTPGDTESGILSSSLEGSVVFVSHVNNPGSFYIQMSSKSTELDSLSERLQTECESESEPVMLKCGDVVCARSSEDGLIYRSEVISVVNDENRVEIIFIDYGNTDTVNCDSVRVLPGGLDLDTLSPLVSHCELSGVRPAQEGWSDVAIETFCDMVLEKPLRCLFQGETDKQVVTLTTDDDIDIATAMIESGIAAARSLSGDDVNDLVGTSGDNDFASETDADNSDAVTQTNLEDPHILAIPIPAPAVPQIQEAVVSYVQDPDCFYVHLVSKQPALTQLDSELQEAYSDPDDAMIQLELPAAVLQVVCVKSVETDRWCRAIVVNIIETLDTDETWVELCLFDFGRVETVPASCLRLLQDRFTTVPRCAIQCCLVGIRPLEGAQWSAEEVSAFRNIVVDKTMVCVFNDEREPVAVNLTTDLVDIADKLTEFGLSYDDPVTEVTATPTGSGVVTPTGEVDVEVCHVDSLDSFFVRLTAQSAEISAQSENIQNEYCENNDLLTLTDLSLGEKVCAKLDHDGHWYRAVVLATNDDSICVMYIDYGYKDTVSVDSIRRLMPELMTSPPYAFRCRLDGVKPLDGGAWSLNQIEVFQEEVRDKTFRCEFKTSIDEPFAVTLTEDGVAVAVTLTEKGCGALTPVETRVRLPDPVPPGPGRIEVQVMETNEMAPDDFYVVITDHMEAVMHLLLDIDGVYEADVEQVLLESVDRGDMVAVCVDGQWFRCKVMTSSSSSAIIDVTLVDLGRRKSVLLCNIRRLKAEFTTQPPLAVHCRLDNLKPSADSWTTGDMAVFREHVTEQQLFLAEFTVRDRNQGYGVKLLQPKCSTNIIPELVAVGCGRERRPGTEQASRILVDREGESETSASDTTPGGTDEEVVVEGEGEGENVLPRTLENDIEDVLLDDELKDTIKEIGIADEGSSSAEISPDEDGEEAVESLEEEISDFILEDPDHVTLEDEFIDEVMEDVEHLEDPAPMNELVYVSHVISPSHFYVQLCSHGDTLETITDSLNDAGCSDEPVSLPVPGDMVAVQSAVDEIWYRAMVLSVSEDAGRVTVQYVDHGNEDEVTTSTLRKLRDDVAETFPCARSCGLDGVVPLVGETWSRDEIDRFSKMVAGTRVTFEMTPARCGFVEFLVSLRGNEQFVSNNVGRFAEAAEFQSYLNMFSTEEFDVMTSSCLGEIGEDSLAVEFQSLANEVIASNINELSHMAQEDIELTPGDIEQLSIIINDDIDTVTTGDDDVICTDDLTDVTTADDVTTATDDVTTATDDVTTTTDDVTTTDDLVSTDDIIVTDVLESREFYVAAAGDSCAVPSEDITDKCYTESNCDLAAGDAPVTPSTDEEGSERDCHHGDSGGVVVMVGEENNLPGNETILSDYLTANEDLSPRKHEDVEQEESGDKQESADVEEAAGHADSSSGIDGVTGGETLTPEGEDLPSTDPDVSEATPVPDDGPVDGATADETEPPLIKDDPLICS